VLFFHESVTVLGICGAAIVLLGVLAVSLDKRAKTASASGGSASQEQSRQLLEGTESLELQETGSFEVDPGGVAIKGPVPGGQTEYVRLPQLPPEREER